MSFKQLSDFDTKLFSVYVWWHQAAASVKSRHEHKAPAIIVNASLSSSNFCGINAMNANYKGGNGLIVIRLPPTFQAAGLLFYSSVSTLMAKLKEVCFI